MDQKAPKLSSAALAIACKVTPQAVNGWRKNGRLAKKHLPTIAKETGRQLEYFLGSDDAPGANVGMQLEIPEAEAIKRLRVAQKDWRRYVLSLAMMDSNQQALMLKTMREAVPDSRVEEHIPVAPHAAARKRVKS